MGSLVKVSLGNTSLNYCLGMCVRYL